MTPSSAIRCGTVERGEVKASMIVLLHVESPPPLSLVITCSKNHGSHRTRLSCTYRWIQVAWHQRRREEQMLEMEIGIGCMVHLPELA